MMNSSVCLPVSTLLLLLLLLLLTRKGLSKGHNSYYYDYDEGMDEEPPTFVTLPQTLRVKAGQSVSLPCEVHNAGTNQLIFWKESPHGGRDQIISVGDVKVTKDRRFSIDGARLTIFPARPRDAGTFLCQFEELEPPVELRHELDVLFPPTVQALGPPEQYVPQGSRVRLGCKADGNPEPVITWTRQEGPLLSRQASQQGGSLTLVGVDRHMEGTYLCTADNGIGEPSSTAMTINVQYPPLINTAKEVVWTGEGDQVELVCLVRGRPTPNVIWTHDGHPLPDTDTQVHLPDSRTHKTHGRHHVNLLHIAHRHTLTINNVTEKDFGAYVCIAQNSHGQKDAVIQMTGLPAPPVITSSPHGRESSSYIITWDTQSYYPITQFIIKYRKSHTSAWQPTNNTAVVMGGSWESVSQGVPPEVVVVDIRGGDGGSLHSMVHTLYNLQAATNYLAVVTVRNKYGWSSQSKHFAFSTSKGGLAVVLRPTKPNGSTGYQAPVVYLLLFCSSILYLCSML